MAEKQKILIVEDNDFVRMQIVRYLKDAGYEIRQNTIMIFLMRTALKSAIVLPVNLSNGFAGQMARLTGKNWCSIPVRTMIPRAW